MWSSDFSDVRGRRTGRDEDLGLERSGPRAAVEGGGRTTAGLVDSRWRIRPDGPSQCIERIERIERTELRTLPTERFEFCEWKCPRVNIGYHVEVDRHYYSVPRTLVFVAGKHTTKTEQMPKFRQKHDDLRAP